MKTLTRKSVFCIALIAFLSFLAFVALFALSINLYVCSFSKPYIFDDASSLPASYTVIVPGARVYQNTVSHVVRDRLETAAECINTGKAERVLISGDHGRKSYDEVNRMKDFMSQVYGTREDLIFTDHAGFSTYETMYRARDIFCVSDTVISTQKIFAARSVFIARKLGLNAVAIEAKEITPFSRRVHISWQIRECLARVKAFFSVSFRQKPKFLGQQIPITGNAASSWD